MLKFDLSDFKNKKLALVLSGGVVKAAVWHVGVSMALEELGFTYRSNQKHADGTPQTFIGPSAAPSDLEISTYVGSSAGVLIALYLASGYSPQDMVNAHLGISSKSLKSISYKDMLSFKKKFQNPKRPDFYRPFDGLPYFLNKLLSPFANFSGFFTTKGLHDYLIKNVLISNNFEDYAADLFLVATQLDHSRKVIFSKYNYPSPPYDNTTSYFTGTSIADAAAASMSVPPFYSPYPIRNTRTDQIDYYIDGEIRETLSTHVAIDHKCDIIISSWTHTPYHYHDEVGSLINYGLPAICLQAIYLMIQKKILSSRAHYASSRDILDTINEYMKTENFSDKHRRNITSILERKLDYRSKAILIDIFPTHEDYKLFFANAFSLSPLQLAKIVKLGYRRTFEIMKNKEWVK